MKLLLSILVLCVTALCGLTACVTASSEPTSVIVNGARVALTANDQKALAVGQNIENSLPIVKATVVSGLQLTFSVDPQLGTDYGAQMWGVSNGVNSLMTGTLPTPSVLGATALSFTSDTGTVMDTQYITAQVDNFQSVYTLAYNKIQSALATTNNAYVIAQLNKAGMDLLAAISGGVAQATAKYAPTATSFYLVRWSDLKYI